MFLLSKPALRGVFLSTEVGTIARFSVLATRYGGRQSCRACPQSVQCAGGPSRPGWHVWRGGVQLRRRALVARRFRALASALPWTRSKAYVVNWMSDDISILNGETGRELRRLQSGEGVRGLAIAPAG